MHCRKYRQRSRMTTREMLEAGFDPQTPHPEWPMFSLTAMGFGPAAEIPSTGPLGQTFSSGKGPKTMFTQVGRIESF